MLRPLALLLLTLSSLAPGIGACAKPAATSSAADVRSESSGAVAPQPDEPRAEPLGTIYGADTTTIEAAPGDRFSLALPHDPQHHWKLDPDLDQSVTRVVEQRTEGATHYVLFDAVGIGPTDLRLRQRGPSSPPPGPPAAELNVRVRVELR